MNEIISREEFYTRLDILEGKIATVIFDELGININERNSMIMQVNIRCAIEKAFVSSRRKLTDKCIETHYAKRLKELKEIHDNT